MKPNEYIRAWQERVGLQTLHLNVSEEKKAQIFNTYETALKLVDYSGKKIIDYGCGGGYLALRLWDKVGEYIGLDISERAISACNKGIQGDNCHFQLIDPYKLPKITEFNADILYSISVIQHFPDQEYLDLFLKWLNTSNIKTLILQIKYNVENVFQAKPYATTHEINLACWTNAKYLKTKLIKYKIVRKTEEIPNEYNYIRFDLK